MSLTEHWINSRRQLEGKTIRQIIAFAGEGHLRDRSWASEEFRPHSHVKVVEEAGRLTLQRKKGAARIALPPFLSEARGADSVSGEQACRITS